MCLLTYLPPDMQPDTERLWAGAIVNHDGHGYAIVTDDRIIVERDLSADAMIEGFARDRAAYPHGPALFHSRFGTGGLESVDNCHPFQVGTDPQTVIAHNGILFATPKGEARCDTRILAETIIPRTYTKLWRQRVLDRLATYLGSWNKIVILTINPRYRFASKIINSKMGVWKDGIWYSNYGYELTQYAGYGAYDEDRCELCNSLKVNHVTGFCGACGACQECLEVIDYCQCYLPAALRKDDDRSYAKWWEDAEANAEPARKSQLAEYDRYVAEMMDDQEAI